MTEKTVPVDVCFGIEGTERMRFIRNVPHVISTECDTVQFIPTEEDIMQQMYIYMLEKGIEDVDFYDNEWRDEHNE